MHVADLDNLTKQGSSARWKIGINDLLVQFYHRGAV